MKIFGKIIVLLGLTLMSCSSVSQPTHADEPIIRAAANAGIFYEGNDSILSAEVLRLLADASLKFSNLPISRNDIAAIIVPHASHFYSGAVAASAYSPLANSRPYKHIFLIGPSHHVWLDGASVALGYDYYHTPLGNIKVDTEICQSLMDDSLFVFNPKAHQQEHCIEVQLPFLQTIFDDVPPIIPVIISTNDYNKLSGMANKLKQYFNEDNLFIISSDFSHYPNAKDATMVDARTRDAILTKDPARFIKVLYDNVRLGINNLETSACGDMPILTLLMMLDEQYELSHILYQNSAYADVSKTSQVVGYHSFIATRQRIFSLSDAEKEELRTIAYQSIASLFGGVVYHPTLSSRALQATCGAFVTIKENGMLRGCVGSLFSEQPLVETIADMAKAAATSDPRFPPLEENELKKISIEISVLTPLRRIQGMKDFKMGKHGLFIRKGDRSGTFLPQVANETDWTKAEFFGHCSQDKAGLGWNGWKTAELYTYEAIVF